MSNNRILTDGIVGVEIDEAFYDLRQTIGWYKIEATGMSANVRFTLPAGIAKAMGEGATLEDLDPDTPIGIEMPGPDVTLQRLQDRLVGWSHKDRLTPHAIKKLPPPHVAALLDAIAELEEAEREAAAALEDGSPFE